MATSPHVPSIKVCRYCMPDVWRPRKVSFLRFADHEVLQHAVSRATWRLVSQVCSHIILRSIGSALNCKHVCSNPLCATFPTEVSCNIPYVRGDKKFNKTKLTFTQVGAAGAPSSANGLCILTQNNINQKIYLMFWCGICNLALT